MIKRKLEIKKIHSLMEEFPVTAILGPRQCGKTTLAALLSYDYFFDLENPRDLAKFENPQLLLEDLKGLIVIDEIQRKPGLFPLLRYLVDKNKKQKYLILGSASPDLIKKSSESLAGRISYFELGGFTPLDVGKDGFRDLWMKGGFPRSFLASNYGKSGLWLENYISSFLERDIPQFGIKIPGGVLRKFWMILSAYHGQIVNYSEIGRIFGMSDMTVRRYIDILSETFTVRVLQPWHNNTKKRLVKNPKIYIRDSGIFHYFSGINNYIQLAGSPKIGFSWEGFAIEQVLRILNKNSHRIFFWKTHAGAELDLFWQDKNKNWGVEFKYNDAPTTTKSMLSAVSDLNLEHLWVIYAGKDIYRLSSKITVIPLYDFMLKFI